jgi:exonuclease SbcC
MLKKKEQSLLDLLTRTGGEDEPRERDLPPSPSPSKRVPTVTKSSHIHVMQLESLVIENLWCYKRAQIDFEAGTTVIAGPNGSGKSSLLESIFFALYGSKASPAMDRSLADVLRIGADVGSVQLRFCYGPQRYISQMALRRRADNVISEKEDCRLSRDDGEQWVGVENVSQAVEELFGMNRDDFTNCVYVRQGEIDRLIRAGEEERRRMIDRLLRLEQLDRYAQRAREGARRALNRRFELLRRLSQEFKQQLQHLESQNLERARGVLEEKIRVQQGEIQELEKKISQAQEVQHIYQEKLRRIEEQNREIKGRQEESAQKEQQLQDAERKEQKLSKEREDLMQLYKQRESQLATRLLHLKLPKEAIIKSLNRASNWEGIEALPDEFAQVIRRQEELHAQLQERQAQRTQSLERISAERDSLLTSIVQRETQAKNLTRELEEMQSLLQQGICPTCKQPVHEGTLAPSFDEKAAILKKLSKDLQVQQEKLQSLESQIETRKKEDEKAIRNLNEEFKALQTRRAQLDELKVLALDLLKIKEQGQEKKKARTEAMESIEALREEHARIRDKIAQLQKKLGDVSELQVKSQQVKDLLQQLAEKKAGLQSAIEQRIEERGKIDTQLEQLKQYQESLTETEREHATMGRLQAELEQLTQFYGALKRELRTRNIKALELYFNQFFRLMDSGASYRGVRVSEDYDIAVELKNGSTIRPDLLSGGERALINIALRSAIHEVLAQASIRMPLILDEPTIYLDRERVKRLQFLLEELGGRIGQVIVVSHELGLVEGADHEYRTEKTADNTSRVSRVR